MTELRTYTERVAAIVQILSGVIDVSKYIIATYSPNPPDLETNNPLWCSWADPETGHPRIAVLIEAVDDINDEVRSQRDHVANYLERGDSHYDPATASEVATDRPDEYVFLFNYVGRVTALVGHCRVDVMPSLGLIKRFDNEYLGLELADFIDAALRIGRTVGCTPYEDDFVRPDFPDKWFRHGWTAYPAAE